MIAHLKKITKQRILLAGRNFTLYGPHETRSFPTSGLRIEFFKVLANMEFRLLMYET